MKPLLPLLLAVVLAGCAIHDRPPHALLPPIAEEYYVCAKCGSLHGGVYGKGPLLYLRDDKAVACIHRWSRISRGEFQRQARARFPTQWADAIPFFKLP